MKTFLGYHSEWNLGSPGGWDYQRITQIIGKAIWAEINRIKPIPVALDFDHPMLYPVHGFIDMLLKVYKRLDADGQGLIALVAEEETLENVVENKNLVDHLNRIEGISSALMAPHELELQNGKVSWKGRPVSLIFMDFNTDVLLRLHRAYNLSPLLRAVEEHRVINPRGTEPINVKSMFEVLTGEDGSRFHQEIVRRTPWTRQFYPRKTRGPSGEDIGDLMEWTRRNWDNLVLKPERGYSGIGVRVGRVHSSADEAINLAVREGSYIVQEKIPLDLWSEEIPVLDPELNRIVLDRVQTDFRCLMGCEGLQGFLGRYGGVPTNVGSGGGVQPLAVLGPGNSVREAVDRINQAICEMNYNDLEQVFEMQNRMAVKESFTYLLGPIKIALRPRLITQAQIDALKDYCTAMWADCLTLETMWKAGQLDHLIQMEEEELSIARMHPWEGSAAIIASDGLFNFIDTQE